MAALRRALSCAAQPYPVLAAQLGTEHGTADRKNSARIFYFFVRAGAEILALIGQEIVVAALSTKWVPGWVFAPAMAGSM